MPKLADPANTLLDGDIVLSKRARSRAWQARYKIDDKWIRVSTGQRDKTKAGEVAKQLYLEAQFKLKHDIPVTTKRFKAVAELAVKGLQQALDAGHGKAMYRDHINVINRYLIPFFGEYNVDKINYELLRDFDAWRREKLGRQPKASSIAHHNTALNIVLDEAVKRGFMSANRKPEMLQGGDKGDRRPDFTIDEYRRMIRNMREWKKTGRAGRSRELKELLYDYVLTLANTGMRPGTETENLLWKHIRIEYGKERNTLLFYVNGKTGPREIVARHNCIPFLKRLHERTDAIKHLSFTELLKAKIDHPVFCVPDGTQPKELRNVFKRFLEKYNLLIDPRTEQERTLYSLRHTYATFTLSHGRVDIHLLAKQMGTSTLMIERHYSHAIARMRAEDLAGRQHQHYEQLDA